MQDFTTIFYLNASAMEHAWQNYHNSKELMMKRSNYRLIDVLQTIQLVATSINVVLVDLQVWTALLS